MKSVYYIETILKSGKHKYSKPFQTKEAAKVQLDKHEAKKQWATLIEHWGLFPVNIDRTSRANLELTTHIRDSYKGNPKHQRGIDACNKHIAELQEKLK